MGYFNLFKFRDFFLMLIDCYCVCVFIMDKIWENELLVNCIWLISSVIFILKCLGVFMLVCGFFWFGGCMGFVS